MPSDVPAPPALKEKYKPPRAGIGRTKGVPNKTTTAVKEALVEAFEQLGGVPALVKFGQENPVEFYKLWVKVLPLQVHLDQKGQYEITLRHFNETGGTS